jgi:hypothetical protein
MPHTYEELKKKTVAELREIAKGVQHEAVQGYSQLNKEHLLVGLCQALGIEGRAHAVHVGEQKFKMKAHIREWKKRRDAALASKDAKAAKHARRTIHRLKRSIAKM